MADDGVTAELERIRAAAAAAVGSAVTTTQRRVLDRYVPSLVAAVEAVLKLADNSGVWQRTTLYCNCGECNSRRRAGELPPAAHEPPAVAWTLDPAKVREAITAALNGRNSSG